MSSNEIIEGTCSNVEQTAVALAKLEQVALAPVVEVAKPLGPEEMAQAMEQYRKVQSTIDRLMPDMIMDIQGRQFRKKGYWRAASVAFRLSLEMVSEKYEKFDEDWGWIVTYRATAPDGVSSMGDGSCFASEKCDKYGKPTKMQTQHNVRSHAHTRAYNRAISNLIGFGEVSAEEINVEEERTQALNQGHQKAVETAQKIFAPKEAPVRSTEKWARDLWTWFQSEGGTKEQFGQIKAESFIQDLRNVTDEEQVRFTEAVGGWIRELHEMTKAGA